MDLGQLDRVGVADQQLEQAAGADRAELGVVAGVDQFGAGRLDQRGDGVEFVGAGHAGLVDDDQVVGPQLVADPALRVGQEPVAELGAVQRGQPVVGEDLGGDLRGRHPEHPPPDVGLPDPVERADGAGLAGPGRSDQHITAARRRQDLRHRGPLLGGQPHRLQLHPGQLQHRARQRAGAAAHCAGDDRRLGAQLGGGGVAGVVLQPVAAQPVGPAQRLRDPADVAFGQQHHPVPGGLAQHLGRESSGPAPVTVGRAALLLDDGRDEVADVPRRVPVLHRAHRRAQHLLTAAPGVALLVGVPDPGDPRGVPGRRGHRLVDLGAHRRRPVRQLLPRRHRVVLGLPGLAPRRPVHPLAVKR